MRLLEVFDDLEQQAEGLALTERDAAVAELSRSGYAEVDLGSRLHAAAGRRLTIGVSGLGAVRGTVGRAGDGWLLLLGDPHEWVVRLAAVSWVRGLPDRVARPAERPLGARLGLASVLRSVAADQDAVTVHRVDGAAVAARLHRVGADFVEVRPSGAGEPSWAGSPDEVEIVPFSALAAVRRR